MREIEERLLRLGEKRRELARLCGLLGAARRMRDERGRELAELRRTIEKEKRDVARLEGLSLQALFRTILGDKEAQLEKECREYLAAKLRLITDWIVQSRIENAAEAVRRTMEAVRVALDRLDSSLREKQALAADLARERRSILERA